MRLWRNSGFREETWIWIMMFSFLEEGSWWSTCIARLDVEPWTGSINSATLATKKPEFRQKWSSVTTVVLPWRSHYTVPKTVALGHEASDHGFYVRWCWRITVLNKTFYNFTCSNEPAIPPICWYLYFPPWMVKLFTRTNCKQFKKKINAM